MTQSQREDSLHYVSLVTIRVLSKIFVQNILRKQTVFRKEKHTPKLTKKYTTMELQQKETCFEKKIQCSGCQSNTKKACTKFYKKILNNSQEVMEHTSMSAPRIPIDGSKFFESGYSQYYINICKKFAVKKLNHQEETDEQKKYIYIYIYIYLFIYMLFLIYVIYYFYIYIFIY